MRGWRLGAVTMACLLVAGPALAAELRAEIKQTTPTGTGESLGTVTLSDGAGGAAVKTALKGLPPGPHGFHVHQNGSCQPTTANNQPVPAGAAGGHYDPQNTGKHEGPEGSGHLGDLPSLQIGQDGNANHPHPGCVFDVEFFGYDAGRQTAQLDFEGQAPTGGGLLKHDELSWTTGERTGGNMTAPLRSRRSQTQGCDASRLLGCSNLCR